MTESSDIHLQDTPSVGFPSGGPRPLKGRVIVVTRPAAQADDLVQPLESLGARVVLFPTIEIVPPADPAPLRAAAREVRSYDWLVFTSVNGVEAFGRALEEEGIPPASEAGGGYPRVCAIGPATGEAAEEIGLHPTVIPDEYVAEAVVEALDRETELEGTRVLLPRAAIARSALPEGLKARGARVEVVEAYRTVPAAGDAPELSRLLEAGEVDLVTFTASSTVRNFHRAMGDAGGLSVPVAAIGPITAATARDLGYDVVVVAEEYTIPGLVDAVLAHATGRESG